MFGDYKPLELQQLAHKVYVEFVDLFTCTFSRAQNAGFLIFVDSALEKGLWKQLSRCFWRASKMGLNKVSYTFLFCVCLLAPFVISERMFMF